MPVCQCHIGHELPADGDAGVVDQNIQPTQFPGHALDQQLSGRRLGYISLKGSPAQFSGECVGSILLSVVMQGNCRTFGGQGVAYRLANAASRAGY